MTMSNHIYEVPLELWQNHILTQLGSLGDLRAWRLTCRFCNNMGSNASILDDIILRQPKKYDSITHIVSVIKGIVTADQEKGNNVEVTISSNDRHRIWRLFNVMRKELRSAVLAWLWHTDLPVPVDLFTFVLKKSKNDKLSQVEPFQRHFRSFRAKRQADMYLVLLDDGRIMITQNDFDSACEHGRTDIVLRLLEIDPTWKKNKAFCLACEKGHTHIVQLLLKDPQVNPGPVTGRPFSFSFFGTSELDEMSPLAKSSLNNQLDVVRILLSDPRVIADKRAMICAASKGHLDILRLLLSHGTNLAGRPDKEELFYLGYSEGHLNIVKYFVEEYDTDPSLNNNKALNIAATNGYTDLVRYLLNDDRVKPGPEWNSCFFYAAQRNGHADVCRILMTKELIDDLAKKGSTLLDACSKGQTDMVRFLLQECRCDPSYDGNKAIGIAANKNDHEIVRLLLTDARVDPTVDSDQALCDCCRLGHLEVVRLLLADHRVNPAAQDQKPILSACDSKGKKYINEHHSVYEENNQVESCVRSSPDDTNNDISKDYGIYVKRLGEIVRLLLQDPRVDPSVEGNLAILTACESAIFVDVVGHLLADGRVDPSVAKNYALETAIMTGSTAMTRMLMEHKRVDPSAHDNQALICAVESRYLKMVKLLLTDARVDPIAQHNEPLIRAAQGGDVNIVRLFLRYDHVDPMERNGSYNALSVAASFGHDEVVSILLADPRVDPGRDQCDAVIKGLDVTYGSGSVAMMLMNDPRVHLPEDKAMEFCEKYHLQPSGDKTRLKFVFRD